MRMWDSVSLRNGKEGVVSSNLTSGSRTKLQISKSGFGAFLFDYVLIKVIVPTNMIGFLTHVVYRCNSRKCMARSKRSKSFSEYLFQVPC